MKQPTIMIVDDEERLVRSTTKIFERLGYSVLCATRGKQALQLVADRAVDIVFLDMNMPGLNGLEVLARIRQQHPLIEVILITGTLDRGRAAEGLRLGAFDFLLKPVSISDFVAAAESAFSKRQAMEEKLRQMLE